MVKSLKNTGNTGFPGPLSFVSPDQQADNKYLHCTSAAYTLSQFFCPSTGQGQVPPRSVVRVVKMAPISHSDLSGK